MTGHIFISYSRHDSGYARRLCRHLRGCGLPVWLDEEIDYGDRWQGIIRDMIDGCAALVPIMTPRAEASLWVNREVNRAQQSGKPILPLLLAGAVFFQLGELHYEDVTTGSLPTARFTAALAQLTATRRDPPPAPSSAYTAQTGRHRQPSADAVFLRTARRLLTVDNLAALDPGVLVVRHLLGMGRPRPFGVFQAGAAPAEDPPAGVREV